MATDSFDTRKKKLKEHLQTAIELEHATIPAYLCAMYTIKPGTNQDAYYVIRSVVIEEMLHLTLAANVLNAIHGKPSLDTSEFVPEYPTFLPHSNDAFKVNLEKFSPEAIDTFLRIELPEPPGTPPKAEGYATIGQFYDAIANELKALNAIPKKNLFDGDAKRQIPPNLYYGGGGKVIAVTDLPSALFAIEVIKDQGEGAHSIWDNDNVFFGQDPEPAHYFRFDEIKKGRYYAPGDSYKMEGKKMTAQPTGPPLPVDWDAVYNMQINPKTCDYPKGSELRKQSEAFNRAYSHFLRQLHHAFNGKPDLLIQAVGGMFNLKNMALALIKNPYPGKPGYNAGPTFELVS